MTYLDLMALREALYIASIVILIYFSALQVLLLLLTLLSFLDMRKRLRQNYYTDFECMARSHFTMPVSVIIPAHNEASVIVPCVDSVLSLDYPEFEVIVLNDGSTDETLSLLKKAFQLVERRSVYRKSIPTGEIKTIYRSASRPSLTVVDKEHSGKSDTLNIGINLARYHLFSSIDADSLFQTNALLRIVRPILERPDEVVAVGGQVRVANGCVIEDNRVVEPRVPRKLLAAFQVVEYLRAFVASRLGLSRINNLLILSGVFALFRKDIVIRAGGYRSDTVTEDMELVVRLHRFIREEKEKGQRYGVVFLPDPICWTEVPVSLRNLARQRNRWHRGLIQSISQNIKMLFNPKYGSVGFVGMPYYFFFEMLGPIVELIGYLLIPLGYFLGILSLTYFVTFLLLAIAAGTLLSTLAVLLEEASFGLYKGWGDFARMMSLALFENFGYRQLTVLFRVKATIDFMFGRKDWAKTKRESDTR
jgi:cellulose synthase/poly-beta-1,6-N-acetylglucosamine synthase-like glycosyltransferase